MKQTPYDVSAYELNKKVDVGLRKWSKKEYEQELKLRQEQEMTREELHVYYYRIGHTLAFPLPLQQLPPIKQFPKGIPNLREYPWYIWLLWDLRERWDALLSAWLQQHDDAAKKMWKEEVLHASKWSHISGDTGQA